MQSEAPTLTIGMPVYNEARYVSEAVESLLAQTRGDFVLHISDNASTDGTPELCRRLAAQDDRVRYELHETNHGGGANWQHVLQSAETGLFMWAGAHDRWAPTFVEHLVPAVEQGGVVLAYGRTQRLDAEGELGSVYEDDLTNTCIEQPGERFLDVVRRLGVCNLLHGIWRTDTLRMGSWARPTRSLFSKDSLMLAELAFEGCYVQVPEVLFYRRSVRAPETTRERVVKTGAIFSGEEGAKNPTWLAAHLAYVHDHWDILASDRAALGRVEEAFLRARITPILFQRHLLNPFVREEVLPKLPSSVYKGLRTVWRRLRGAH